MENFKIKLTREDDENTVERKEFNSVKIVNITSPNGDEMQISFTDNGGMVVQSTSFPVVIMHTPMQFDVIFKNPKDL
jgi:archaellum component FlaF (FlaF/FlaG flagellin family)